MLRRDLFNIYQALTPKGASIPPLGLTVTIQDPTSADVQEGVAPSRTIIVGAGPAGLTAAYELTKLGHHSLVLELDDDVGGISKTCEYKGYRFDLGGHRFFTKVDYVQQLWNEILGDEFLDRPRLSRIHYRGHLFDYPLRPMNALFGLGPFEAARILASYMKAHVRPHREEVNFEQWVSNRFGHRLYEIFFKTYTEKVWGIPCTELSAKWAAQRIKNLDLKGAILNAFFGERGDDKERVTTLIERFQYPRYGPGQMWRACVEHLKSAGSHVELESRVKCLKHDGTRIISATIDSRSAGERVETGDHFISSMPIKSLLRILDPAPPAEILALTDNLAYRDFMIVALVVEREELFPDNWIYIHSADVQVGRVQNFKNWSPDMVPDASMTALGLEYFLQEGDELWNTSDEELVALARKECAQLGLASLDSIVDGTVIRVKKAYPIYSPTHAEDIERVRAWLARLENLQLVGRNGQHHYNNQDHSMMTGVLAARNIAGERNDLWSVNVDEEYHEERRDG